MLAAMVLTATLTTLDGWLDEPVEGPARAGVPVRFVDPAGGYVDVLGLTVRRSGPVTRGEHLGRGWMDRMPAWLTLQMFPSRYGAGQSDARRAGVGEARQILGRDVPAPALVHSGTVSGTSTGLAWFLATVAQQDPQLLPGRVAATGTVVLGSGTVVPVTSLAEKMASPELADVTVVFVPHRQRPHAVRDLASAHPDDPTPALVVGIRDVAEAVGLLCLVADGAPTQCRGSAGSGHKRPLLVSLSSENLGVCTGLRALNPTTRLFCGTDRGGDVVVRPAPVVATGR